MTEKLVFGYWDLRGIAQPLRYLLEYLGLDYEEIRYHHQTPQEWVEAQQTAPINTHILANLPYIKDGDKWVYESQALYIYIPHRAKRPELLGSTPEEKVVLAQVKGVVEDLFQNFWRLITTPEEIYDQRKDQLFSEEVLPFIQKLNLLIDGKQWAIGNNITVIDFFLFEIEETLEVYQKGILEKYPALKKHQSQFSNLPSIKAYLSSERFIKAPFYKPGKRWN